MTAISTERTTAQVEFGTLDISDRSVEQTSEIQDVQISVNANWKFDASKSPDARSLQLHVGKGGNFTQIVEERLAPRTNADSGTETLTGSIIDTPHFAIDNFRVDSGEKSETIDVKLVFELEMDGEVVESTSVTDTATLTVKPGSIDASVNVKGTGEIQISR